MKISKFIPAAIVALLSLLFISLFYRISLHCTSYFDLGIYSDALNRINWHDLNPFIPGRNIRILNDHFDPILIPFSFFTRLINAPTLGILIEFIALIACWFPLRELREAGKINDRTALFCYAFILLNHSTIDAVQSPFHPTTWAVLPMVGLFSHFILGNFKKTVFWMIVLFCCREEFPLIGPPMAAVMAFDTKRRKKSVLILTISMAWISFVFYVRPKLFDGYFENYGRTLLKGFIENPSTAFSHNFSLPSIRFFLERTLPLLLVIDYTQLKRNRLIIFGFLFITAPILLVRFASFHWGFHYGTAAVISILFALITTIGTKIPNWRWALSIVFLLGTFISEPIKVFTSNHPRCSNSASRLSEIEKAQKWIANSGKAKILLENNLASTQFFKSPIEQKIYMLCSPSGISIPSYDVVLVEKPEFGDAWPCGFQHLEKLINQWKTNPNIKVLTDNEYIFLAEGIIKETP